jgi:ASC-1-like (ASCH) protein
LRQPDLMFQTMNAYHLLNERERLVHEVRNLLSSSVVLSQEEKLRRENVIAEQISKLWINSNALVGQTFHGTGKVKHISKDCIVVSQPNMLNTYDYSGKSVKRDCNVSIVFASNTGLAQFTKGDKVVFNGNFLGIYVHTYSTRIYDFRFKDSVADIQLENVAFQKQDSPQQGCFIATAVYRDPEAPVVQELQIFRDDFLLQNRFGRRIVYWYYQVSPKLAKSISCNPTARLLAKHLIVLPAFQLAKLINKIVK